MTSADRRLGRFAQVDGGKAELVPDPKRRTGWLLLIEGVAQSYVDDHDPQHLEFEYVRRVAGVLDAIAPKGRPLDVLHLGGGAMTLPRYIAATRPGSAQVVVERDPALVLFVHTTLPLPPDAGIEVRVGTARDAVERAPDGRYDVVIADAYDGAIMPRDLTSVDYARRVARVLRPGGTYLANVTDLPVLAFTRIQAAALQEAFGDVAILGEPGMLRGRRFGNVVLVATAAAGGLRTAAFARPRGGERTVPRVLSGADLIRFVGGAEPITDAEIAAVAAGPEAEIGVAAIGTDAGTDADVSGSPNVP